LVGAFAPAASACPAGAYTYAGLVGFDAVSGVGATVTPSATGFDVLSGHVAGWVGVGGPGEGPGGSNEWLQAGLATFPLLDGHDVYYEVARPGTAPTYHRVEASIVPGSAVRVGVLEMHGRPNWWRVWVNGAPASNPIYLPASHGRWRPIVTAESWDGGASSCNAFLYAFTSVSITLHPGGIWSPLGQADRIAGPDTLVARHTGPRFDAAGGDLGLRALAGR
jgi:hypothetical protein